MGSSEPDTLALLRAAAGGDLDARNEAWSRLHTEILRVVRSQWRRWSGDWTLETSQRGGDAIEVPLSSTRRPA